MNELIELREWVTLLLVIGGFYIAWRSHGAGQKQRKLENSFKLLELFENNIESSDLDQWKEIFKASSEVTGVKSGYYYSQNNEEVPLDSLYSEGPADDGAIVRITDQLELISTEVKNNSVELRIIYARIGQIMRHIYSILEKDTTGSFELHYPNFIKVMSKNKKKLSKWTSRTIVYCE